MKKKINPKRTPVIGITANLMTIDSGSYVGFERSALVRDYIIAIQEAKGIPIVLPVTTDEEMAQQQMEIVDGLLLSGGNDIAPIFFQEPPLKNLDITHPERDLHEMKLIQTAYELKKPIFGICRGLQILNTTFGGSLYQDIPTEIPEAFQHYQKTRAELPTHLVTVNNETKLRNIFEEEYIMTNSFHHQGIKKLAPRFVVNASTADGIIEGIEMEGESFILAVQWHPELLRLKLPKMMKLFKAFVEAAGKVN